MPTRLTKMEYDEISLVDAGANNDDIEGAHVLLAKRAEADAGLVLDLSKARVRDSSSGSTAVPTRDKPAPKGNQNRQRGTTQRAANWKPDRHPRVGAGNPGGGEFASTSSSSKKKYGKGGTAKDNLPKGYGTTNKDKTVQSLQQSGSASLMAKLPKGGPGGGGGSGKGKGKGSAASKAKKAAAAAKKIAAHNKKVAAAKAAKDKKALAAANAKSAQIVSIINGLAPNQRAAYRDSKRPVPVGYIWIGDSLMLRTKAIQRQAIMNGLPSASSGKTTKPSKLVTVPPASLSAGKGSRRLTITSTGRIFRPLVKKSISSEGERSGTVQKALLGKWLHAATERTASWQ